MAQYTVQWDQNGIGKRVNVTTGAVAWIARLDGGRGGQSTHETKADAKAWLSRQTTKRRTGKRPTKEDRTQTFAQYIAWWLDQKASGAVRDRNNAQRKIGRRTLHDYRALMGDWITDARRLPKGSSGRIGHVRVGRLTFHDLNALYDAMHEVTTVGTVRALHRLLGQVFVDAVAKGVLDLNPCDIANVPAADEKKKRPGMTVAQAQTFLRMARENADTQGADVPMHQVPERCWSARWFVAIWSGLRPGEVRALRWDDVEGLDSAAPVLHVREALEYVPGKDDEAKAPKTEAGVRDVPLALDVARELKQWKRVQAMQRLHAGPEWEDDRTRGGLVFTMPTGAHLTLAAQRRAFERVSAKAELGTWTEAEPIREHKTGPVRKRAFKPSFRVYDCRHTCVTLLRSHGVPDHVVAAWIGHGDEQTLPTYSHVHAEDLQRALATLGKALTA